MEGTMSNIEQETWDQYNGLMLGPDIERIRKMLVRYDLFRQSLCSGRYRRMRRFQRRRSDVLGETIGDLCARIS